MGRGEIRGYERGQERPVPAGRRTEKVHSHGYAELLAEKKAAYADYRKAREEMKELLTAKANIDRILELDKEQEEANERREKEAEQR